MDNDTRELIFVYNADAGLLSVLKDAVHRIVSPSTYPCRLCAITTSLEGMRSEWKTFVRSLDLPARFLHKDELKNEFDIDDVLLPAAFLHDGDAVRVLISADQINRCRSLDDLKVLVAEALW